METDIIARMRAEEADLMRKLKAVRDFLAAYGERPANALSPAPLAQKQPSGREKAGIEGFGEYGRKIVAYSMLAMLPENGPMRTRQIVDFLASKDVEITGENKINAVGALLSRSADIVSHGKAGWTLADRDEAADIVAKYGPKENEPTNDPFDGMFGGSDADGQGAPPPWPSESNLHPGPTA